MSCFHPKKVFYTGRLTESGALETIFTSGLTEEYSLELARKQIPNLPINTSVMRLIGGTWFLIDFDDVPCGVCIGCHFNYAMQWSIRCQLEAAYFDHGSFLTVTYDDEHKPSGPISAKRDIQLFIKRVRKRFGELLRYFLCYEYGEWTKRPHFHIVFFGLDVPDLKRWDDDLCQSEILDRLWSHGRVLVGEITDEACAYTARYTAKKCHRDLGEFLLMSRRPGIGYRYWSDHGDMFARGKIYHHHDLGNSYPIPNYYRYLEKKDNRLSMVYLSMVQKPVVLSVEQIKVAIAGYDPLDVSSVDAYRFSQEAIFNRRISVLHRSKV